MTVLWFLFNSSSAFPHRTYEAYLKDPRSRPHRCTRLWKLVSRSFRGRRPKGYYRLPPSEDVLPYGIPDDLPSYEETERYDVAEGHRQSVGGPWFPIRLVLRSIHTYVMTC